MTIAIVIVHEWVPNLLCDLVSQYISLASHKSCNLAFYIHNAQISRSPYYGSMFSLPWSIFLVLQLLSGNVHILHLPQRDLLSTLFTMPLDHYWKTDFYEDPNLDGDLRLSFPICSSRSVRTSSLPQLSSLVPPGYLHRFSTSLLMASVILHVAFHYIVTSLF